MNHDATSQPSTPPVQDFELAAQRSSSPWKGRLLRLAVGTAAGGALGFALYLLVGCSSGCAILSSPYISLLYGAGVGLVAAYR